MNRDLEPRACRMLFWALLLVFQICGGPLWDFSVGARETAGASAPHSWVGDSVSAPECAGAGAKSGVGWCQLGASAAVGTTWKVPGLNGIYGGLQGGLEAVVDDAGGGSGGLVSDVFGNVRAASKSAMDGLSRVGSYGLLPGAVPDYSEEGQGLAAATFWRGRRSDLTGLVYMGARYYDPGTGRFLSPDPLGHGSSASLYDYADGDPVNRLDPDGRVGKGLMSDLNGGIAADAPSSTAFSSARVLGGAIAGWAEGPRGGGSITLNTFSFGATDWAGITDSDQYEGGAYTASRIASTVGREGVIALLTGGLGNMARAGSQGAYYGYVGVQTLNAARSGYQIGTGIDDISQGNYLEGSLNVLGGGLGLAGGLTHASGVFRPAANSGGRTFTSADPLVGNLANKIEAAYPGHVVG
ncbi:MAG: hypothetical protein RL630_2131 [Verrucomicrobiota bacterium]|jgi:RHS repeat-associated protein